MDRIEILESKIKEINTIVSTAYEGLPKVDIHIAMSDGEINAVQDAVPYSEINNNCIIALASDAFGSAKWLVAYELLEVEDESYWEGALMSEQARYISMEEYKKLTK